MASSKSLTPLTEPQIRELATPQSFDRGQDYYRKGTINNPTRQGSKLWADCWGSELYQTSVTLDGNKGVAAFTCSCPYDWGGLCKHQVALLLTYLHQPESFYTLPPLVEMLASRSREDLVALIERMVQQDPNLLSLVELSAPRPAGKPVDTSTYRRQVQRALGRNSMEEIVAALEVLLDSAQQLLQKQDWLNAGALYQVLLEETTTAYDYEMMDTDYDGEICGISQDFADGLGQCLEAAQDDSLVRTDWLTTLLEAYFKNLDLGGMDFAAGAADALLEEATEDEWSWIESKVRDEMHQSKEWKREALVRLLTDRQQDRGDKASASAIIQELGSPQQRAFLLVKQGQVEQALTIAQAHFTHLPGLVIQFADALLQADQSQLALQYITELNRGKSYWGYEEWLVKYHREQGDPQTALQWQQQIFQRSPSLPGFQELRELAQPLGSWDSLRAEILQKLEQDKNFAILIDVAILEEDGDRALELLKHSTDFSRFSYRLRVAAAVEKSQPREAISLYQGLVENAISERNRSSYQTAAGYLKKVKALYKAIKAEKDWQLYIQKIRTSYPTLRALQDELNRAGL